MSSTEQTNLPRALIEHLADAVIFADRDGVIQLRNPGAQAVMATRPRRSSAGALT
jgi:nitrogen-specific signal transduction histidine kinase